MPSRNRSLSTHGLWFVLAALSACIEAQEEVKSSAPPPIVGSGKRTSGVEGQPAGSGSGGAQRTQTAGAGARTAPSTQNTTSAADGGMTTLMEADLDAGPSAAGSPAAGAGGQTSADAEGSSSMAGAGGGGSSGGGGAGGRAGAGGQGGAGGAGGQGGAGGSTACINQLCFSVIDCWLLSPDDCNYTACENFVCR